MSRRGSNGPGTIRQTSNAPETLPLGTRLIEATPGGGDVEEVEIAPPETAFVRQIGRDRMGFDDGASRCEDVDQWSRSAALAAADCDDIAVAIKAHPFDPAMMTTMIR